MGALVLVREARGPAGPRGGIGPGSSGTFGPSWWDEPGPMGLTPGPPPFVPVGGLNRFMPPTGTNEVPIYTSSRNSRAHCSVFLEAEGERAFVCKTLKAKRIFIK